MDNVQLTEWIAEWCRNFDRASEARDDADVRIDHGVNHPEDVELVADLEAELLSLASEARSIFAAMKGD